MLTGLVFQNAGVEFVLSREKHHELIIDGVVIPFEVKRHLPIPSWRLVSPSVDSDSDPETFVVLVSPLCRHSITDDNFGH